MSSSEAAQGQDIDPEAASSDPQIVPQNTEFTCFSRLPVELRIYIWKLSLEPRVVELKFEAAGFALDAPADDYADGYDEGVEEEEETDPYRPGFFSPTPTPATLKVCRESRNAVAASYPRCFGSIWYPKRVRFNMSIDTLYLTWSVPRDAGLPLFFSILSERERSELRYLVFEDLAWRDGWADTPGDYSLFDPIFARGLKRSVELLKSLREVLFAQPVGTWYMIVDPPKVHGTWQCSNDRTLPRDIEILYSVPPVLSKFEFPVLPYYTENWKVKNLRMVLSKNKSEFYKPRSIYDS